MPKEVKAVVQAKVETETLMALATCDTITEAAAQLGIARNSLYERIHKYGLTEKLKDIKQSAQVELLTGSGKAAAKLLEHIDSKDPNVSLKATTETLDRIGITKPSNNSGGVNINFNNIAAQDKEEFSI